MNSPASKHIKKVLLKIGISARRKAFRKNLPVAISEEREAILLYPEGTKKKITPKILTELASGSF